MDCCAPWEGYNRPRKVDHKLPGERVSALDVWVDGQGVVHRLNVEFAGSFKGYQFSPGTVARLKREAKDKHISLKQVLALAGAGVTATVQAESASLSVSFTRIGQPEVITAPAGATDVYGQG